MGFKSLEKQKANREREDKLSEKIINGELSKLKVLQDVKDRQNKADKILNPKK